MLNSWMIRFLVLDGQSPLGTTKPDHSDIQAIDYSRSIDHRSMEGFDSVRHSAPVLVAAAIMLTGCLASEPPSPTAPSPSDAPPPILAGQVIVIDPGHNGGNAEAAEAIAEPVDVGNGEKPCDTTGTNTDDGYPEHRFNFDVAERLVELLEAEGATVLLTRDDDVGVGPCITERVAIANDVDADAAVSIHADGGPADGSGFHIMEPIALPGHDDEVVDNSHALAVALAEPMSEVLPPSDYIGQEGLNPRDDMGGLNLTTVPKVMVECGNMRNDGDARLLADATFRQDIAAALATGLTRFLTTEHHGLPR